MDDLSLKADAARKLAASRLINTDNHVSGLLAEAGITQNAYTHKPAGLSFPYSAEVRRGFSFDLDPQRIEQTSIEEIAEQFTQIVYDSTFR